MDLHPLFLLIFWDKAILKDIDGDFGKLLEVAEHKGCQFLCLVFVLKSSWIKVSWRPFLYSWMRGYSSKNCITMLETLRRGESVFRLQLVNYKFSQNCSTSI